MSSPNEPQDQNNLIYAIILSIAVLMGWQYFFAAPATRDEKARDQKANQRRHLEPVCDGSKNKCQPEARDNGGDQGHFMKHALNLETKKTKWAGGQKTRPFRLWVSDARVATFATGFDPSCWPFLLSPTPQ